jgi:hypothetical protein
MTLLLVGKVSCPRDENWLAKSFSIARSGRRCSGTSHPSQRDNGYLRDFCPVQFENYHSGIIPYHPDYYYGYQRCVLKTWFSTETEL